MSESTETGAAVRVPPPLVFILGALASWGLHSVAPLGLPLPPAAVAAITAVSGVVGLSFLSITQLGFMKTKQDPRPWKPTPSIMDTGIYAWSRNPMYIGMAAVELAIGAWVGTAWILLAVPLCLWIVYTTAVRHEEAYLLETFGEEYADYMRRVRRWI